MSYLLPARRRLRALGAAGVTLLALALAPAAFAGGHSVPSTCRPLHRQQRHRPLHRLPRPLPRTTPTHVPTATPPALPPGSVEAKVGQALGTQLGVAARQLRLTAKHAREWPDSALGCPAPGRAYSQIVTPGFQLTYRAGAQTYDVHTDQSGDRAVLCQNKQPVDLPTAAD
jgi:hypothetical protein